MLSECCHSVEGAALDYGEVSGAAKREDLGQRGEMAAGEGWGEGPFPEGHGERGYVWQEWDQVALRRNCCQNLWGLNVGRERGVRQQGGAPCSGGS